MTEAQVMLRLTLAQKMIAEIYHSDHVGFGMSKRALERAYAELNDYAMRHGIVTVPPMPKTFPGTRTFKGIL